MPLFNIDIFDDLPVRLKEGLNPYLKILKSTRDDSELPVLFGSDLEGKMGGWRKFFESKVGISPERLVLEVGVHKGKVLADLTESQPKDAFLGIDITFKRVIISASKLENRGLKNGHILLGNAKQINQVFAPGELDGVIIFFPDPWKKPKQAHNRLLQAEFCNDLVKALRPGGFFWFKTDCPSYFHATQKHMSCLSVDHRNKRPYAAPFESTFERRFKGEGLPICEAIWWKV